MKVFIFFLLCALALLSHKVQADAVPLPDYTVHDLPLASTFYWFSSVEVEVCYSPKARIASIKGALHCTHQDKYDIDNNTWTLPQTCVALKPLGGPLSSAVRDSCANAKGVFNVIKPASGNDGGNKVVDAIKNKGAGGTTGGDQPDSNEQEDGGDGGNGGDDGGEKKKGGLLGMFGL